MCDQETLFRQFYILCTNIISVGKHVGEWIYSNGDILLK
jgi:hypothetical protein